MINLCFLLFVLILTVSLNNLSSSLFYTHSKLIESLLFSTCVLIAKVFWDQLALSLVICPSRASLHLLT